MLIHFETKRCWSITIVSPNHNTTHETSRPGARSFAYHIPKSPAPVDSYIHSKASASLWPPVDSVEEDCPPPYSASTPKHRSSLRKICRFLTKVHRMYPRRTGSASHGGPPPPPYQRYELPPSPTQELPEHGSREILHELQGDDVSELQTNNLPHAAEEYQASLSHAHATNMWRHSHMRYGAEPPPTPMNSPKGLRNVNSGSPFAPFLVMGSGAQSQESSPTAISPVTTHLDDGSGSQAYGHLGYSDGTISPQDLVSSHDENHWQGSHPYHATPSYHHHSSFGSPQQFSLTQQCSAYAPNAGAAQLNLQHGSGFSSGISSPGLGVAPYAMGDWHSFPEPDHRWYSPSDIPLGVYESDERRGWHHRPSHQPNTARDSIASNSNVQQRRNQVPLSRNVHHSAERQPPVPIHAAPVHYEERQPQPLPEVVVPSGPAYPPECCPVSGCNTWFNGRYRKGNLRRHDLRFHNPPKSLVDRICRDCKKLFNRPDACKKHEWEVHRRPDAKSKKRTK
ncbi:hypothetical protein BDW02DRAFT_577025 [Decorospora gaudefroyi]|uniref:C2H2-type domain-containing protein n=1 Tax=Decorospora gaudefroyi TaxID=184978 RepID=A0A6A5KPI7_9PLEO|nr:hypothetical protein BDW02DRAFT_577025 [Decorospora gaudefroyi]